MIPPFLEVLAGSYAGARSSTEAVVSFMGKGDGGGRQCHSIELSRRDGVAQWRHEGNFSQTLLDREPNE